MPTDWRDYEDDDQKATSTSRATRTGQDRAQYFLYLIFY